MRAYREKIEHLAAANAVRLLENLNLHLLTERCESPIEQLLLTALWLRGDWVDFQPSGPASLDDVVGAARAVPHRVLMPQVVVGSYRVDLMVAASYGVDAPVSAFAIECDGHEFHEKTKEQAARDKARDRTLTFHGLKVLRFTGAEIWRDADDCAGEVLACVHNEWSEYLDNRASSQQAELITGEASSGG